MILLRYLISGGRVPIQSPVYETGGALWSRPRKWKGEVTNMGQGGLVNGTELRGEL